jgi:hypothetical protein
MEVIVIICFFKWWAGAGIEPTAFPCEGDVLAIRRFDIALASA